MNTTILQLVAIYNIQLHVSAMYVCHRQVVQRAYWPNTTGMTHLKTKEGLEVDLYSLTSALDGGGESTPPPLYPRERDPVRILHEAGWAPGSVWTGADNFTSPGFRSPLGAHSERLYWLGYLGPLCWFKARWKGNERRNGTAVCTRPPVLVNVNLRATRGLVP